MVADASFQDPDPTFHCDADPYPEKMHLQLSVYRPSTPPLWESTALLGLILSLHSYLLNFDFDAYPDPAFDLVVDPTSQNDADQDSQHWVVWKPKTGGLLRWAVSKESKKIEQEVNNFYKKIQMARKLRIPDNSVKVQWV
jgi:hypothetical protein